MTLGLDVEQTRIEINDGMIERARLVALLVKTVAYPVDMGTNRNGDGVLLVRCRLLNRGIDTVAKRVTTFDKYKSMETGTRGKCVG